MKTMTSPGRGAHGLALRASETAFECRMELAELFNVPSAEQVVFTFNATHALNIAIRDLVSKGDKVVVSGYEHNAVMRPLHLLGADIRVAASPLFDDEAMINEFTRHLYGAKAAICTAMSNVFGYITPLREISRLCREANVPLIVDASQLAGCGHLDFRSLGAAYMAMPGHKGLLGPQGTGILLCDKMPAPFLAGGSGSESKSMSMPDVLPDRLEAGTHNMPGSAGLLEGVRYVKKMGREKIGGIERRRMEDFANRIRGMDGVETFYCSDSSKQGGVLSVRHAKFDSELLAQMLSERSVAVRAGLHCAPLAHETGGTIQGGTVRFSFSPFLTEGDVIFASKAFKQSVNKQKT